MIRNITKRLGSQNPAIFSRWVSLIGIAALVAVIGLGLAGCGDDGEENNNRNPLDDLPKINESTTGRGSISEPNITLEGDDVAGVTISDQPIEGGAGTWAITAGKFSFNLGTPSSTTAISTWLSTDYSSGGYFSGYRGSSLFRTDRAGDVTVTPVNSDAKILGIRDFQSSSGSTYYTISRSKRANGETYESGSYIIYVYVDQDVTLSREAKTYTPSSPPENYTAFNLPLKEGWNLVQADGYGSDTRETYTVKIADKDIPWRVYVYKSPSGSEGE